MSKAPPPLLGFNNNVRHRGRIFHIQTEDSGVKFPRIVTHLFADGGRIVKTTRTDYTVHLGKTDMAAVVRGMMKEQHKAMFAALRAGDMDALLESACGPLEALKSKPTDSKPSLDLTSRNDLETARVILAPDPPLPRAVDSAPPQPPAKAAPAEPPPAASAPESLRPALEAEEPRGRRPLANPNLRRPTPSVTPPEGATFDLDVASLDKNPPRSSPAPSVSSARSPRANGLAPRKSRPPIPNRAGSGTQPVAAVIAPDAAALSRPQTRLAAAPASNARSIFGDGAISEQSLDEVILSYLAEDLEETK